nr:immunoglobulin heavy chain junction region [Macaca mulatta]
CVGGEYGSGFSYW